MNFSDFTKHHSKKINETLDSILPPEEAVPSTLHRAMRYSIFNGGKRIRPLLVIASSEYMGIPVNRTVYTLAAMVEMVHTYSLVHDDLPSMDNDDLRRGKPTVHRMFNEAIAVLAGDALLTGAFEVAGTLGSYKKNGDLTLLLTEFTSAIGSRGLVGGQVMDLEKRNGSLNEKDIRFIHHNKTAALILFSVMAPALFFKKRVYLPSLRSYGEALGMAFQIGDDIADQDKQAEEPSIVNVLGLDESKKLFYDYIGLAKKAIKHPKEGMYLAGVCDWVTQEFNV